MSIKTAIDAKSGKNSKNIEDAINNLELSSGGGVLISKITLQEDGKYVFDKKFYDIFNTLANGTPILAYFFNGNTLDPTGSVYWYIVMGAYKNLRSDPTEFTVKVFDGVDVMTATAAHYGDYPSWEE